MKIHGLCVIMLLFPWSELAAQVEVVGLAPGTRVRLSAPEVVEKCITASIAYMDSDSLVLHRDRNPARLVIPARTVERLEISHGRSHSLGTLRGVGLGALGGGLFLGGAQVLSERVVGAWTALIFLSGAIVGAPVGAVVGGIIGVERWEERPLWPRAGLGTPPVDRVGLSVSWRLP